MSAREIGLFPLASVLVPGEMMPLHIFEERYKSLVDDCRQADAEFALLYSDSDGARELGTTARIVEVLETFRRPIPRSPALRPARSATPSRRASISLPPRSSGSSRSAASTAASW